LAEVTAFAKYRPALFSPDYASLPGFPTQAKEHHEKDADSFDPDSNRAANNVRNNRTGRWWWNTAAVLATTNGMH
jgi:hypothetical protein